MNQPMMILACSFAVASCASDYVYRPAANATATIKGRVAADYPVPPASPQGDVRLASFGMSEISSGGPTRQNQKAVHLRMIVADNGQTPWTMDTRQQVLALADGQQLAPGYVTTHEGQAGLPSVTVPAGGKRIIDLFYPLPPTMQSASKVPDFDVVWHIDTPQQQVTERTPFDRIQIVPAAGHRCGPEWGGWQDCWGGPFYGPTYPGYRGDIFIGAPRWDGWEGGRREGWGDGHR
jgi:hypothetical protein